MYAQTIQIYKEYLELEDEIFKLLSFKLSSNQLIKRGSRPKFTLEDNLGRKWIFKPDYTVSLGPGPYYTEGEVAAVVYRVYKLFGLRTPRVYFITLDLNGKKVSGGIQEYIYNKGVLSKRKPYRISQDAIKYILEHHTLDWLISNHNSDANHFLVLSFDNNDKPMEITHVDNETSFFLLGQDELEYDWVWRGTSRKYYYMFWKSYLLKKINPDVNANLSFIKFITEFPDDFFAKLILPAITHNFKWPAQFEFKELKKEHNHFFELILSRKHNLMRDFKKFYKSLAEKRNEVISFTEDIDCSEVVNKTIESLIKEKEKLKKERLNLQTAPSYSSKIDVIFSTEGFFLLFNVYEVYWKKNKRNLFSICEDVLTKLSYLESAAKNEYEKEALGIYIREIKRIRSGKQPSFRYSNINEIVESVVPKLNKKGIRRQLIMR